MSLFNVSFDATTSVLKVGFGDEQSSNDKIIVEAAEKVKALRKEPSFMGPLLKINGACSLPIAVAIAHEVNHLFGVIAVFDPKLSGYVVAVSHGAPTHKVGDLIPA